MHPTIPPTTTPQIVSTVAQHRTAPIAKSTTGAAQKLGKLSTVAMPNWQDRSPLTSPDIHAKPRSIAQSELPGGSTPPPTPPSPNNSAPSTVDTGDGYPTRIPANYFGPAIGFGNGPAAFGVISRFPFGTNYSIRPSAVFGGGGTIVRVPVTYDFALGDKEPFERNPLITFHAGGGVQYSSGISGASTSQFGLLGTIGVDVNLFEGVALLASFNTDFGSLSGTNFGLGFEF